MELSLNLPLGIDKPVADSRWALPSDVESSFFDSLVGSSFRNPGGHHSSPGGSGSYSSVSTCLLSADYTLDDGEISPFECSYPMFTSYHTTSTQQPSCCCFSFARMETLKESTNWSQLLTLSAYRHYGVEITIPSI